MGSESISEPQLCSEEKVHSEERVVTFARESIESSPARNSSQSSAKKLCVSNEEHFELSSYPDSDSYQSQTPEPLTPEKKTFSNHLLLKKILIGVSSRDLVNCRLVTSGLWLEISTKLLIKRRYHRINFQRRIHDNNDIYIKKTCVNAPLWFDMKRTLQDFIELLQHSTLFPVVKFGFFGPISSVGGMADFLTLYGSSIKELELDLAKPHQRSNSTTITTTNSTGILSTEEEYEFEQLLTNKVPNLDLLFLHNLTKYNYFRHNSRFLARVIDNNIMLPNMKFLLVDSVEETDVIIYQDILNKCPNVQYEGHLPTSYLFNIENTDLYVKLRQCDLIKHLLFNPTSADISLFETLAAESLELNSINFNFDAILSVSNLRSRVSSCISKLLNSSQHSLSQSVNIEDLGYIPGLNKPPQFVNVDLLVLDYLGSKLQRPYFNYNFLPHLYSVSACFPNLRQLHINCYELKKMEQGKLHYLEMMETVEELTLCTDSSESVGFWLQQLYSALPNVTNLKIKSDDIKAEAFCYKIAQILWEHYTQLTSLQIKIQVDEKSYPMLDRAFTGIPRRIVRKLQKGEMSEQEVEKERENRVSILNLKDLECLNLKLKHIRTDKRSKNMTKEDFRFLTKVTEKYAFKKMTGHVHLKVVCSKRFVEQVEKRVKRHIETPTIDVSSYGEDSSEDDDEDDYSSEDSDSD